MNCQRVPLIEEIIQLIQNLNWRERRLKLLRNWQHWRAKYTR